MKNQDISTELQGQVKTAYAEKQALNIVGGNSKAFYGRAPDSEAQILAIKPHQGIINYEPTELVITARAGTPLTVIEKTLAKQKQMLAFEPPHFGKTATLGGTIAGNFSGPARPYAGAARDHVLGCKMINGKGEILSFGGEVMKNVAGYDVSRLMTGALGTLGVLLEVSLKVLPQAEQVLSLRYECSAKEALQKLQAWGRLPLPISASCFEGKQLWIRLSGSTKAVEASAKQMGGELINVRTANTFWRNTKEQEHVFFTQHNDLNLWRLSLTSAASPLALEGDCLYEWGGTQRWLYSGEKASKIRQAVEQCGGHATLFRSVDSRDDIFHPLSSGLLKLHQNLKKAFDPHHILNPQRMYQEV